MTGWGHAGHEELRRLLDELSAAVRAEDLDMIDVILSSVQPDDLVRVLERFSAPERAVMFRLLPKDTALWVFEQFDPGCAAS